jgi:integrase
MTCVLQVQMEPPQNAHYVEKPHPFSLTAILTGMRLGELLSMEWSLVDWHRGQYFVKESL